MNILMLLEILKKIIFIRLEKELTLEDYEKTIVETPTISIEDNIIPYKETELLYHLFQLIPYYQVYPFLENLIKELYVLEKKNPKSNATCKRIASLLDGVTCSLFPSIKSRTITELNGHIYELLKLFYQDHNLNNKNILKKLKRNLYSPEHLTGWDVANYEQLYFFKDENLREKISKTNYYRKYKSEDTTLSYLSKCFNSTEEMEEFLKTINNFFDNVELEKEDIISLKVPLLEQIAILQKKFEKKLAENDKKKDEYQLTLQFFNDAT